MSSHLVSKNSKAWVVAVNMGYGHERAASSLKDLASGGRVLTANDYPGMPERDRLLWLRTHRLYEFFSRLQPLPIIGPWIFGALDYFQKIYPYYPRRDLSAPTLQLRQTYNLITRAKLGKHLIEQLAKTRQPLVTTFFLPAFAADYFNYPEDIYLVACDTDVSRAWVTPDPKKSRIKYLVPNGRVAARLLLYGVPEQKIFLTGFPLPKSNIGGIEATTVKKDLCVRLQQLDPQGLFRRSHESSVREKLGDNVFSQRITRPLTITFSIGGAGAQRRLGLQLLASLQKKLGRDLLQLNLEAGTHADVAALFTHEAKRLGLGSRLGKNLHIHLAPNRTTYFQHFNETLRHTDILWTKPSELSFYCGLGLPLIIAPPIGSQEFYNRRWLERVGAGQAQGDPRYADEWLFDWLDSGYLARYAWHGFLDAPTHGTYRIESLVRGEPTELEELPRIV